MRALVIGTTVVLAATALSGCVGFDGEPTGRQISAHRVQVAFNVCKASATPTCSDQGNTNSSTTSRILVGLRVRKGTSAPDTIRSITEGIAFDRDADYTRELNQTAPRSPEHNKWFGWVTRERRTTGDWPAIDRLRIRLRLANPRYRFFRYRPVVGYQQVPEVGPPEPIDCGGDPFAPDGTATATCIDAPGQDETRTNLKFRLNQG